MSDNKKLVLLLLAAVALVVFSFWIISPLGEDLGILSSLWSGSSPAGSIGTEGPELTIDLDSDYRAVVKTTEGNFTVELLENNAPFTVNNFVYLSRAGFYSGSEFHRVIPSFVVQAGLNEAGQEPRYNLNDEINASSLGLDRITVGEADWLEGVYDQNVPSTEKFSPENLAKFENYTVKSFYVTELGFKYRTDVNSVNAEQWSVGMANEGPNTASAQFFIVTASAPQKHLDGRYTIFGEVIDGFSTIHRIESLGQDQAKITDIEILQR